MAMAITANAAELTAKENAIVEIVARVNAAQRLIPSAELEGTVTALMGVISQYRLVASQHTAKREKPEPGPGAAS